MGNDLMEETTLPDLNQESSDGPRNSWIRAESEDHVKKNSFSAELVARALGLDSFQSDDPRKNGDFFDCNLCLSSATEPVLTCCGHLFCWPCFYNLPYEFSNIKDCPVCGGDVSDTSLVPIYGNTEDLEPYASSSSSSSRKRKSFSSGLEVPPRPKAKRVENPNQRRRRYDRGELMDVRIEQRIRELAAVAGRFVERARAVSPAIESASLQSREAIRFSRLVLQQRSSPLESENPEELNPSDADTNSTPFIESASLQRLEALDFSGLIEQRSSSFQNVPLASSEPLVENSEELRNTRIHRRRIGAEEELQRNADTNPTQVRSLSGYQYFAAQSLRPIPNLRFILPEIDLSATSETLVENSEELSTRIGREEEFQRSADTNLTPVPPLSGYQYFAAQRLSPIRNLRFILPEIDLSANSETLVENPEELSTRIGREEELQSSGNTNPVDTVAPESTTAAAHSSYRFSPRLARWLEMPSYGSEFDAAPMSLASPTAPSSANGPSLRGGAPRER